MNNTTAIIERPALQSQARDVSRAALARLGETPASASPTLPRHVENLLALIQSHFAASRDARAWDRHDDRDYGRILLPLTGEQCRAVFALLRERHTFRPSVAEVKAAVGAVIESLHANLPPYAAAALRDARSVRAEAEAHRAGDALQIVGTGENPTRQTARERIRSLPGWRDSGRRAHTERFNAEIDQIAEDAFVRQTFNGKPSAAANVRAVLRSVGLSPNPITEGASR